MMIRMDTKFTTGCLCCGAPLLYRSTPREQRCTFCGQVFAADAECERGHFVCDGCHQRDGVTALEQICRATSETDMLALLQTIRSHPSIPIHGPEHHAMVPAIIVVQMLFILWVILAKFLIFIVQTFYMLKVDLMASVQLVTSMVQALCVQLVILRVHALYVKLVILMVQARSW